MNQYQVEQLDALKTIRWHLEAMDSGTIQILLHQTSRYLDFRRRTAEFLHTHFASVCTRKCYLSRLSACCSRDGIITFFADMVINVLNSSQRELSRLEAGIKTPADPARCIYLSPQDGCLWKIKPVVCEFFLCHEARQNVFDNNPGAEKQWEELKQLKKTFTWPDRPIVFEFVEQQFIVRGCDSPLMYMHNSPGLVKIREKRDLRSIQRAAPSQNS